MSQVPVMGVGRGSGGRSAPEAGPYVVGCPERAEWRMQPDTPSEFAAERVPGGRVTEWGGVSGIVVPVEVGQTYHPVEGMSHGVGDDAGYRYTALVRPATPQEAAPLLEDEERETARLTVVRRMHQLLAFGDNDSSVDGAVIEFPPSPAPSPEVAPLLPVRVPIGIGAGAGPRPEIRVDRAGGWVWTLLYAGTGAYDPQLANYRGWIAVRHPLTPERGQLLEELIAWFPGPGEPRPA